VTNSSINLSAAALESAQSRFAQRLVVHLSAGAESLGADISERLRFARESAVQHARSARALSTVEGGVGVTGGVSLILGGWAHGWGLKAASFLPLVALVAGLMFIQYSQTEAQISVAAEVDADLLADDLPPKAYVDAGFVEFLKMPKE
jgi:Protein of unknown function (DUF3619)